MTEDETKVLKALGDHYDQFYGISFVNFRTLELDTGLPRSTVRDACRALRDKGLAEFRNGLWREDDRPGGSGYAATKEGVAVLDAEVATP